MGCDPTFLTLTGLFADIYFVKYFGYCAAFNFLHFVCHKMVNMLINIELLTNKVFTLKKVSNLYVMFPDISSSAVKRWKRI